MSTTQPYTEGHTCFAACLQIPDYVVTVFKPFFLKKIGKITKKNAKYNVRNVDLQVVRRTKKELYNTRKDK